MRLPGGTAIWQDVDTRSTLWLSMVLPGGDVLFSRFALTDGWVSHPQAALTTIEPLRVDNGHAGDGAARQ